MDIVAQILFKILLALGIILILLIGSKMMFTEITRYRDRKKPIPQHMIMRHDPDSVSFIMGLILYVFGIFVMVLVRPLFL